MEKNLFHTGYFDYAVAFQMLLDPYWMVMEQSIMATSFLDILRCMTP